VRISYDQVSACSFELRRVVKRHRVAPEQAKPLFGCVNDIDEVQRVLVHRLGIPTTCIRRLASPAGECAGPGATLGNIRDALRSMACGAGADDRVIIYFSGHGASVELVDARGRKFHREALVPVDVSTDGPSRARLLSTTTS
jgi:hypothetical protein